MKVRNTASFFLVIYLLATTAVAQQEESDVPESPTGYVQFITLHSDGEKIMQVNTVKAEGEMVAQTYTVMVPYEEGGVTKHRAEKRTRMTQPTKRVLQPLGEGFTFVKLDGSEISNEEFLESIPMTGQKVVIIPSGAPFEKTTEQLKDLLADSTIIMKMPVSLTYDE